MIDFLTAQRMCFLSHYQRFSMLICIFFYSASALAEFFPQYNLAFYYGPHPPVEILSFFKNVVIEPSSGLNPHVLEKEGAKVYAYASLGEAINLNQYGKPIDKSWVLAKNQNWQSLVLDQTNPAWQAFFINQLITPLWNKGYRGFFLDTLDSYRIVSEDPQKMKKQQEGIISTIRAIKAKYPDAKLILNRGFEVLPEIKTLVDGVVAESLFNGWNNQKKEYFQVSEKDRQALLKELYAVKKMGIPVTVVDYLSPKDAAKAEAAAKKIADLGFNPWITDSSFTQIYLTKVVYPTPAKIYFAPPQNINSAHLPRKVLILYDGKVNSPGARLASEASQALSMPINYLGYITILHNVRTPLPKNLSPDEYAGIVAYVPAFLIGREDEIYKWYKEQMRKKIPIVILYGFGFSLDDDQKLKTFGLSAPLYFPKPRNVKIVYKAPMMGYEANPVIGSEVFEAITLKKGTVLLRAKDEDGIIFDAAGLTPWGGYYLTGNVFLPNVGDYYRWSVNPFEFFKKALRFPDQPIPDLSSENGRRLMLVHIDGDGFANKGEWYKGTWVSEVMRKEFLERYNVPTTVSIIQGEIAPNGLYPKLSPTLEAIARRIFALPNVEIASHTYSHPYNWEDAENYKGKPPNPFTILIPNYVFNNRTEVVGSVEYIDQSLSPLGKKCRVFLWPGDGNASEQALSYVYQQGLANLNPGSLITNFFNSKVQVPAMGLYQGPYFQVFAPTGNDYETIVLNPVFYSIIDIIDAFKLTDKPQRLKPIDIYFHFFTLDQLGGVKAMHKIFEYALSTPVMNIFVSDYFNKVQDFIGLSISKEQDGWSFLTNDDLRELRIPQSMGYPDLVGSTNVIGYSAYNKDFYLHLGPGGKSFVRLTEKPPTIPFLMEANARVTRFLRKGKDIEFSLEGYLPAKFILENVENCSLWRGKEKMVPQTQQGTQKQFEFKRDLKYDFALRCE